MKSNPKKRILVFQKCNERCAYCGVKIQYSEMHVDHITPIYRKWRSDELLKYGKEKGTSQIDNLNPSCASCNTSKSTFTVEEWRLQLEVKITRLRRDTANFRLMERFGKIKIVDKPITFYFETI